MRQYKVIEQFDSINGEGKKAGSPAHFIRFAGCNLRCTYCDTMYANESDASFTLYTAEELLRSVKESGIKNVTLTGGEPLIQEGIYELLKLFDDDGETEVEVETNGSVDIEGFKSLSGRISFTLDYKLPESGMESRMRTDNYLHIRENDTVKFVAGSIADLDRAYEIIKKHELEKKCNLFISPVFGKIDPAVIVEYMVEKKMNGARLGLQLHKIIWDPDMRGV